MDEKTDREHDYTQQRLIRIIATAERDGYAEDEELYWVDDRGRGSPGAGRTLADLREHFARREALWDKIEEIDRWGFDPENPPDELFEE